MTSLQGKLLLASPAMEDPNFGAAVVLMVEHGEEGALGLVINKPTTALVRDVLPDELQELVEASDADESDEQSLRHGGPCRGPLMVLHRCDEASQVEVLPGLHFATHQELVEIVLRDLVGADDSAAERRVLYFAGYAGWGPGQLEGEIEEDAWAVVSTDTDAVFGVDETTWTRLVRDVSKEALRRTMNPKIVPPDASLN
ncbi:MAG: YqgE/AlgH family protein [Planctomycetota bacterium]